MPAPPPNPAAESLAALLRWLVQAMIARTACGWRPFPLLPLIIDRIRGISQLVARVAAGRYFPRRFAPRGHRGTAPPPHRLPQKSGWLLALVPDAVGSRAQLENLLNDPEMAALMAAAPVPMGRALRPLCRMLGVVPPPILAPPAKPRAPRTPKPATPAPQPPAPRLQLPPWLPAPHRIRKKLARICGPPAPA